MSRKKTHSDKSEKDLEQDTNEIKDAVTEVAHTAEPTECTKNTASGVAPKPQAAKPIENEPSQVTPEVAIAKLEAEKQELQEGLLRKQADFENYRRRMYKEKEEAIQFANRSLISELLEVLDNFERALVSHQAQRESNPEMEDLFVGLEMVEKQLADMLCGRWGLKVIDSVGQEFDPKIHEALLMEESVDCQVPTVVENLQTGYTLHDRVLRPARVKVGKPAE